MNWKKIGLNLLYPHLAVILILLPISIAFLVLSLIYLTPQSILAIISYLLSFYVLLVICFRVPRIITYFKTLKEENKYLKQWFTDVRLRIKVSLYGSLIWNVAYAIFQLILGFYYMSFWFFSMFAYYVLLAVIRFFLLNHTKRYQAKEEYKKEIEKYKLCGWLLLFMNLALSVIIFFIVYLNKTFQHNMITTIAMAFYTFVTFTFAIINIVKYKKYQSPVYSASKTITLISACVSMLTLETTMLTTFGGEDNPLFKRIILSTTGFVVIAFAITMALIMIIRGTKKSKSL
ncbi:MAG: hypothetical protein J6C53_03470 [Clostridia bacterium]|nr:hypothetical protein [Clostridia bacterium]